MHAAILFLVMLTSVLGCATTPTPAAAPPPPLERTLSTTIPVIAPLPETQEVQQTGGISVEVRPVPFSTEPNWECEYVKALNRTGEWSQRDGYLQLVERRFLVPKLLGDDVQFLVTITNRMQRVFRAAGAVVQVSIDGRLEGIEEARYNELVTELLPPGQRREFTIKALSIKGLPQEATVGLVLFDLVTAIDAAGNITERHNFQWFYRVTFETRAETVTGERTWWWVPEVESHRMRDAGITGSILSDESRRNYHYPCHTHEGWLPVR